jgi:hypothetical protein
MLLKINFFVLLRCALFKGTVSRDFFTLVFFIKHLLLVPLDTPRKDFEFFRIFDSPVYSLPGSRFGHRGVILLILKNIQQSLKGLSF